MELILITLLILPFIIIFYKRNRFFPWSTRLNLYRMSDMLEGTDNARKFYQIYSDIIKASKTVWVKKPMVLKTNVMLSEINVTIQPFLIADRHCS